MVEGGVVEQKVDLALIVELGGVLDLAGELVVALDDQAGEVLIVHRTFV